MNELPAPPIPADADLRAYPYTPIFRSRLFGSAFHARVSDSGWRAGVTLWLKSWDQSPCGSLPDDDIDLCRLAELGRDMKAWKKVKAEALHGWSKCSDGRLYHKVVAEGVLEALGRKAEQKSRTEAARLAKEEKARQASEAAATRAATEAQRNTVTTSVTTSVTEPVTTAVTGIATGRATAVVTTPVATAVTALSQHPIEGKGIEEVRKKEPPSNHRVDAAGATTIDLDAEARTVVETFHAIVEHHFGNDPPPTLAPKDLSIAKAWLEDGAEYEPIRAHFDDRMRKMVEMKRDRPRGLLFFDNSVREDLGVRPRRAG